MRALHSTLSDTCKEYKISNDFKSSSLLKAKEIMSGVQTQAIYRKDTSKQARGCTDEEFNQAMNMNILKCNGSFDLDKLCDKYGFCVSTGFCIRGDEIHRGKDEDLVIGVDNDGYQCMDLTIYYDKTRTS